ncbi:hypothetical protein H1C71_012259, partial [Ictidomys tridecemlineatus]
ASELPGEEPPWMDRGTEGRASSQSCPSCPAAVSNARCCPPACPPARLPGISLPRNRETNLLRDRILTSPANSVRRRTHQAHRFILKRKGGLTFGNLSMNSVWTDSGREVM